jgi:PAS domain-containing protein
MDERAGPRWADERLRLATEAAHLGLWEWDIVRNVVHWSPGLEIIHGSEIVKAHGGRTEVTSSVSEGTVFTLRWPCE